MEQTKDFLIYCAQVAAAALALGALTYLALSLMAPARPIIGF